MPRRGRGVLGVAALAVACSTGAAAQTPPSVGQGRVLGVRMAAEVTPEGAASVVIEVDLDVPPGMTSVPFRGLTFGGASPLGSRVSFRGETQAAEWDVAAPPLVTGRVSLDSRPPGPITLGLAYELAASPLGAGRTAPGELDLQLPILMVDWPPVAAAEGMFDARITLPAGFAVVERFPTAPLVSSAAPDGGTTYGLSLPAVPSMVRMRARRGNPGPGFGARVDAAVIAALAVLAVGVWVGLRRGIRAHG